MGEGGELGSRGIDRVVEVIISVHQLSVCQAREGTVVWDLLRAKDGAGQRCHPVRGVVRSAENGSWVLVKEEAGQLLGTEMS